jgi:hypothetical protein
MPKVFRISLYVDDRYQKVCQSEPVIAASTRLIQSTYWEMTLIFAPDVFRNAGQRNCPVERRRT